MIRKLLKTLMQPNDALVAENPEPVDDALSQWNTLTAEEKNRVLSGLYPELKRIAQSRMRRERSDHTLQPSALVNEFFLQLANQQRVRWSNRTHFMAAASQSMRRLLVDYSRSRSAQKRGGQAVTVQLDSFTGSAADGAFDLLEFDELIDRLAIEEPRMARVVELRCFGGLPHGEIAEILGVDARTVKRDWAVARAWLYGQLRKGTSHDSRSLGTDQD